MDIGALKSRLEEVKGDAISKANDKELKGIANYLNPDETPMLFFKGTVNNKTKKILLTNGRVLFISSGMFSGVEITDIPLQKISDVTSNKGIMFGKIKIFTVVGNIPVAIDTYEKDVASRFAMLCSQFKSTPAPKNSTGISEEQAHSLDMLFELKEKGAITEDEYNREKNKILGIQKRTTERATDVFSPITSTPFGSNAPKHLKKEKPVYVKRILQGVGLLFLFAIGMNIVNGKDPKTGKETPQSVSAPSSGEVNVDLNTKEVTGKVLPATRKEGSKAFIKQNGTTLYKTADLKNSLGDLAKGTEVRIREGVNGTSEGLPVRYKVQVMVKGKADKLGWVVEDGLANPVQVTQKQKSGLGNYPQDVLDEKKDIARAIIYDVWGKENNWNSTMPRARTNSIEVADLLDGTFVVDMHIRLDEGYNEDAILVSYTDRTLSLMKKLFENDNLKGCIEFRLYGSLPMQDKYGNVSESAVTKLVMPRKLAQKIQWDKFDWKSFHYLMMSENGSQDCQYWIHRGILSRAPSFR